MMAIEQSHGKARPTLPRSKELGQVGTVGEPNGSRGDAGRFASGNQVAVGRGWKHAIAKSLGRDASDGEATVIAKDAWRVYLAVLREMPHTGALVRTNVARHAREFSVAAFYDAKATEEGLATDRGMLLADKAASHGARAERHAVTALDIATKLSNSRRKRRPTPFFEASTPKET
jgi:hypothetical protein